MSENKKTKTKLRKLGDLSHMRDIAGEKGVAILDGELDELNSGESESVRV